MAAWNPASGDFRPNFPVRMNDLQFLTGPSVADIDPGSPGEEMVAGSAYLDLQAYTGLGKPVAGFPKLTADWMVANPLIGSFGSLDKKVRGGGESRRPRVRLPHGRRHVRRGLVAALPPRQRQLGRRTTATPSRPGRPTATRSRARP